MTRRDWRSATGCALGILGGLLLLPDLYRAWRP